MFVLGTLIYSQNKPSVDTERAIDKTLKKYKVYLLNQENNST